MKPCGFCYLKFDYLELFRVSDLVLRIYLLINYYFLGIRDIASLSCSLEFDICQFIWLRILRESTP